jgi:hypothetical protein
MEYCEVLEELPFWTSTVARSGFRSPSKSAIAKFAVNPAEETGDGRVEVLAAFARPGTPRTTEKTKPATRELLVSPSLLCIHDNLNPTLKGTFLKRTAPFSPPEYHSQQQICPHSLRNRYQLTPARRISRGRSGRWRWSRGRFSKTRIIDLRVKFDLVHHNSLCNVRSRRIRN